MLVAEQRARTLQAALQVVVANENPRAVHIARSGFTHEQVRANHQLLAGCFKLLWRQGTRPRRAGEELRPLAGNQVRCRRPMARTHRFRERVQRAEADAAGADRVQRELRD
ncbi:hypothetical protein D3C76_1480180 [compost metagenome]